MTQKKESLFLTDSWRGTMASCLVIITAFVIAFTVVGATSKSYLVLGVVDGAYALSIWGYVLLFTGKSKSETLKRFMMLFSIVAATTSAFLLFAFFTFQL